MAKLILIQGYASLLPVIGSLSKRDDYRLLFFQRFVHEELLAWGQAPRYLEDYLKPEAEARVAGYLAGHARRWEVVCRHPDLARLMTWEGRSIWGKVAQPFWDAWQRHFRQGALWIEMFEALCQEDPPSLVIVCNDVSPATKVVTRAAQEKGVPVLHLEHASPAYPYPWNSQMVADHLAVFGPRDRDWYVSRGAEEGRVTVTGNPHWDDCPDFQAETPSLRERLGIPKQGPLVLFCSTWVHRLSVSSTWTHVEQAFRGVVKACRDLGGHLLVKPHPATPNSHDWHRRIAQEEGVETLWFTDRLRESLAGSDVVFCFDSNAGIEALLLDRPVVSLRYPPFLASLFQPDDAVLIAHDDQEVQEALRGIVEGRLGEVLKQRRPASISRFNGAQDGRAIERVLELVERLSSLSSG